MSHPRKLLRAAIATAVDGIASRRRPTSAAELPARLVYISSEEATGVTIKQRTQRNAVVVIEQRIAPSATLDDALDDAAEEIEAAMAADPTFGGKAATSVYAGMTLAFDTEPETPQAVMQLRWAAMYFV